jgi:flagellar assembly protein FliH
MGVIKAERAKTLTTFSMSDLEARARLLVSKAHAEADQILKDARAEAEKLKADASATGLAEGKRKGLDEGRAQGKAQALAEAMKTEGAKLAELVKALSAGLEEVNRMRLTLESDARENLLMLAVAIARKVTHREGKLDSAVVEANVHSAIQMLQTRTRVRLSIHPDQRDLIESLLPQLKLKWPTMQHVEIVDDVAVRPGGCRVESASGQINAELDEQIDRIASELVPQREGATQQLERFWPSDMID